MKNNLKKQNGIATVLIVLLVGVALSASTLGVIYTVKSSQSKQVASHAKTNANSAAWMLAEAANNFIRTLTSDEVDTISDSIDANIPVPITLNIDNQSPIWHLRNSTITITGVTIVDDLPQFDITIVAIDLSSQSRSDLQVVIQLTPGQAAQFCGDSGGSQFTGDVAATSIDLYMDGENNEITVDGGFGNPTDASSIHGIRRFVATGDIYLKGTGNGELVELIKSNRSVVMSGSINAERVEAGFDVISAEDKNPSVNFVVAAGDIIWHGHTETQKLEAGVPIVGVGLNDERDGDATLFKGDHPFVYARGTAEVHNLQLGNGLQNIYSREKIDFVNFQKTVENAISTGDIECDTTQANITNARYGKSISGCSNHADMTLPVVDESVDALIPAISNFSPVELQRSLIADADLYHANYKFQIVQVGDTTEERVHIQDVNGIENGWYVMYSVTSGENKRFNAIHKVGDEQSADDIVLCNPNGDNECIDFIPTLRVNTDLANLGQNADGTALNIDRTIRDTPDDRDVVEINAPDGIWVITANTTSLPAGTMYFDRDLRISTVQQTQLINGFFSAGDVQIRGGVPQIFALNGVPADVVCGNERMSVSITDNVPTLSGSGGERFPLQKANSGANSGQDINIFPLSFCDDESTKKRTVATENAPNGRLPLQGQFAIIAGQENQLEDDAPEGLKPTYQGGDLFVQNAADIFGRVVAGNTVKLVQGTELDVYGSIGSEARRDGKDVAVNDIQGTLKIHTDYLEQLDAEPTDPNNCNPENAADPATLLIFSRYL